MTLRSLDGLASWMNRIWEHVLEVDLSAALSRDLGPA